MTVRVVEILPRKLEITVGKLKRIHILLESFGMCELYSESSGFRRRRVNIGQIRSNFAQHVYTAFVTASYAHILVEIGNI